MVRPGRRGRSRALENGTTRQAIGAQQPSHLLSPLLTTPTTTVTLSKEHTVPAIVKEICKRCITKSKVKLLRRQIKAPCKQRRVATKQPASRDALSWKNCHIVPKTAVRVLRWSIPLSKKRIQVNPQASIAGPEACGTIQEPTSAPRVHHP